MPEALNYAKEQSRILQNAERIFRLHKAVSSNNTAIAALEETSRALAGMVRELEHELPLREEAPEGQVFKIKNAMGTPVAELGNYVVHHTWGGPSVFFGYYREGEADHLQVNGAYYASRLEVVINNGANEVPLYGIGVDGQTARPIEQLIDIVSFEPVGQVPQEVKRPPREY